MTQFRSVFIVLFSTVLYTALVVCQPCFAGEDRLVAAINHKNRPQADLERDARSKPQQVLSLVDIKEGMVIADIFSASGYYAELLNYLVGETGKVYAHNNQAWLAFVGSKVEERFANNRLPSTINHTAENDNLGFQPNSLDGLLMIMTYHDLYHVGQGWPKVNSQEFMAQLFKALKPGGFAIIVDHAAKPGSGMADAQKLHRIDVAFAKEDFAAAGFEFDQEADFLRNPKDNHAISVFAPQVKGKTDRFVLVFRKPKS